MSHLLPISDDIDARHIELYTTGLTEEKRAAVNFAGLLQATSTGQLMLSVPISLVRGLHDALDEPGVSLPHAPTKTMARAGIVVMTPAELQRIGGPDVVTERVRSFRYMLGEIKDSPAKDWPGVSRCWHIEVNSPDLQQLRKTYGLHPLLEGVSNFSIVIGCRRTGVLGATEVSKVVEAEDAWHLQRMTPHNIENIDTSALHNLSLKIASNDWYLGQSEIQGQGIFAGKDYEEGERIGEALRRDKDDEFGSRVWDLTLLGRFSNHQEAANTQVVVEGDIGYLVTTKPVQQDTEFTASYKQVSKALGFGSRLRYENRDMPAADFGSYVELGQKDKSDEKIPD